MRQILYDVISAVKALGDLSSVLHITQHKHRLRPDLCTLGRVEQDTSVGSRLLIFRPHKTLIRGVNSVFFPPLAVGLVDGAILVACG